jgi:hypothetical protein
MPPVKSARSFRSKPISLEAQVRFDPDDVRSDPVQVASVNVASVISVLSPRVCGNGPWGSTMTATIVYHDRYGATIDWPEDDYIEIRWYDTTAAMTGEEFNEWLSQFAGCVEAARRRGVLVDSVQFWMDMARMDAAWRDAHIIPRYNAAGVEKFAFLMPEGMPAIGGPPSHEGPADFPTAYFATRADALAWLGS